MQSIYLFWANHLYTHGIGEIVFTVDASLSGHYSLKPTHAIKASAINVIIDEFSNPYFVDRLAEIKKEYPQTKYVFIATEFITPISLFGYEFARTFNFFASRRDWFNFLRDRDVVLRTTDRIPSYMHRRYLGFARALPLCDLLAFVHPKIARGLKGLADLGQSLVSEPVDLYPELTLNSDADEQLNKLSIGFDLTGTQTGYRRRVMRKLERRFARCGFGGTVWRHVKFEESEPIVIGRSTIRYNYNTYADSRSAADEKRFLFNINPPQRARWPFSSPMRIARAAMLGQIPTITSKFGDHEIEDIAFQWDGSLERAQEILSFGIDRNPLLQRYLRAVERYNAVAKSRNRRFIESLDTLLCQSA
jgi:hypothetical protein